MDELSKTIDSFLTFTNIQEHHYGIPKVNYHSNANINSLYTTELHYYHTYSELISKINRLIYLNELKILQDTSSNDINDQYTDIMKHHVPINYQDNALDYLTSQNNFKTESLLNKYLEISLPILRSIHHYNDYLTSTETVIHNNLELLYSQNNATKDVNINKILHLYNQHNDLSQQYRTLHNDLYKLFQRLKPKLQSLKKLDEMLEILENESNQIKLTNIKSQEFNEVSIKKLFKKLAQKWCHISILCDFLPNFILCLPLNWFEDKTCNEIIEKCADLNEKYGHYQALVNKENIKDMNIEDLLMMNLK